MGFLIFKDAFCIYISAGEITADLFFCCQENNLQI